MAKKKKIEVKEQVKEVTLPEDNILAMATYFLDALKSRQLNREEFREQAEGIIAKLKAVKPELLPTKFAAYNSLVGEIQGIIDAKQTEFSRTPQVKSQVEAALEVVVNSLKNHPRVAHTQAIEAFLKLNEINGIAYTYLPEQSLIRASRGGETFERPYTPKT